MVILFTRDFSVTHLQYPSFADKVEISRFDDGFLKTEVHWQSGYSASVLPLFDPSFYQYVATTHTSN
ncbi:MAG: hypothetical protein ACKO9I_06390 [Sphaerospermopsis kisseleviana]|jgi:hypothetical protein|uniref:Uncharacterized protein n=2 Tax=Sphaerospermopsis TaxID=752201 RepID=A0ABR9V9L5_9CYAN|nr:MULTISPECIES: hypothetical protein [Sphaerospermopsis]MBE9235159.1 hypothetical protein [Sphaerospermopsis aphanizomenoides LEGE 00250]MDB9441238.1 hypothetical protein [Sphaerospermopsis kisseleviana CS-549]